MSNERFWNLAAVALVGLLALKFATPIVGIVLIYFQHGPAMEQFPKRHLEATTMIERTYAHFVRFGTWPNQEELDAISRETLPSDWICQSSPEHEGAVIILDGPFHFILVYSFEPPQEEAISREWTFSNEGSKSTFQSSVAYSVENASETEDTPAATADSL